MACGCNKSSAGTPVYSATGYVWTSAPDEDGQVTQVEKRTEVEVRALVIRQGGTYAAKTV